ncbi:MAG: hypothetical protein BAJATHORv1_20223 [Candidatus Thorarchaeota archaeon]|nr:MAG: hypothetical protein BAJATHORv1_20223 [Candidatus Thorarchaeota archaeon]
MLGIDISLIMQNLSKKHQIFRDVTEFRVCIGRELHRLHPSFFMAMQCPLNELPERDQMEICLEDDNDDLVAVFDLTYHLDEHPVVVDGVSYQQKNRLEIGRFTFFNSLSHVERIVSNRSGVVGFVVFLTNSQEYWTPPRSKRDSIEHDFRIHEGFVTKPIHSWTSSVKEYREDALVKLRNQYTLTWADFSRPCDSDDCLFRYLAVEVHK